MEEYGKFHHGEPSLFLPPDTKPHEIVERIITEEFLDTCLVATNRHGEEDENFVKIFPEGIPVDEGGRALLKGKV